MDKSREEFESLCHLQGLQTEAKKPDGRYWSSHTHLAWEFWQASRKQALKEACDAMFGLKVDKETCFEAWNAIRSLEGNATKETT